MLIKANYKYIIHEEELPIPVLDKKAFWSSLSGFSYRAWFDSGGLNKGTTVFAWGDPLWIFKGDGKKGTLQFYNEKVQKGIIKDPLKIMRRLLNGMPTVKEKSPFSSGGAIGYWGYESAQFFTRYTAFPRRKGKVPDFIWFIPRFMVCSTKTGCYLYEQKRRGDPTSFLDQWKNKIINLKKSKKNLPLPKKNRQLIKQPFSKDEIFHFKKNVQKIKKYIIRGDIYQANLTHEIALPFHGLDSTSLFHTLKELNPSPYSVLLDFPTFSLVSCSPELLVRTRQRHVETRPIAGTRPRGKTLEKDKALSGELILNKKERAEHIMLVDLERNDLGKVCRPGTVHVSENMVVEKYSHVFHIVSHVEGDLKMGKDSFDALRAVFPGGTITGCPKIRCMEILQELEKNIRGPFYGSAGWIKGNGDMDLNILIRTALIKNHKMHIQVGAGIVADSVPHKEWEETFYKAMALMASYYQLRT